MTLIPDSVVRLTQELVRIPSVNPDGDPGTEHTGEEACAKAIGEFLEAAGAEVFLDEVETGRPNVIGHFPSNAIGKPRVLFAPHTDTVSVAGMTIEPFSGELRDDKVWGRGASDTKGPMASMLWALWEMRDRIPDFGAEIHFVGFMSEESAQLGSRHFARHHDPYDLAIIAEPTGMEIVHKHRGCVWADVHTTGKAAHSSRPELGENAIGKMMRLFHALDTDFRQQLKDASGEDPLLGKTSLSLNMIRGGSRSNIVPDQCTLRVDMRTTPGLDAHGGAFEMLQGFVRKVDPTAHATLASEAFCLDTDADHPLIRKLEATGAPLVGAPWFCDAAFLAAAGTPAVAMGPGSIHQAHTEDEHIAVKDLEAGTTFFQRFLESL